MSTFHAIPGTLGDVIEADAVRVVGCITAIAKQEDVFSLCRVADGAWVGFFLLFFGVLPEPLLYIEFGNLLFILDVVGGNGDAIQTVVDSNRVEGLAADGASIGLLSPGADACIVDDVVAAIEGGHDVEMAGIALSGLGRGRSGGVDGRVALRRGRGVRQRIQTYDTLVRLRHDADCDDRRQ